uniref:Uncharacterized protein n=1 Tax=Heterostelium pallidum TaxID=13642 RepID=B2XX31_HETPA|nr:hypothetical protein [Heterostelium pallidum]
MTMKNLIKLKKQIIILMVVLLLIILIPYNNCFCVELIEYNQYYNYNIDHYIRLYTPNNTICPNSSSLHNWNKIHEPQWGIKHPAKYHLYTFYSNIELHNMPLINALNLYFKNIARDSTNYNEICTFVRFLKSPSIYRNTYTEQMIEELKGNVLNFYQSRI